MARSPVKLALFFSHLDHILEGNNARLLEVARMAEDEGADQAVFSEHVTLAQKIEGVGEAAKFPFEPTENYPEPLVALAAIAGATKTLRLATGILIAPLRRATVLAKAVATLDHVSNSRFDLGVGAGWHIPELKAVGVEPNEALEVLEDTVRACRALWTGEPAS